jgi:RimJ/RimL family protein N-acetyltransferase
LNENSASQALNVANKEQLLVTEISQFGFEHLGLQRIESVAAVGNKPSQRVAEKANAKKEGVLRRRLLIHGVPHNAVLYSLLKEDIESKNSTEVSLP